MNSMLISYQLAKYLKRHLLLLVWFTNVQIMIMLIMFRRLCIHHRGMFSMFPHLGLMVENGELHLNGQHVVVIPRRVAMLRFLDFVKSGPTILVAHKGRKFDTPVLLKELHGLHLISACREVVCGFYDSLPVLKNKLPESVKAKQSFCRSSQWDC